MLVLMLVLVAVNVAALVALAVVQLRGPRRWAPKLEKRKVIVHTTDGSIDGVLMVTARDGLVLSAATYLDDERPQLAGEMFIPRAQVAFIQVPPV